MDSEDGTDKVSEQPERIKTEQQKVLAEMLRQKDELLISLAKKESAAHIHKLEANAARALNAVEKAQGILRKAMKSGDIHETVNTIDLAVADILLTEIRAVLKVEEK